jgi:hypothetical protein
MVLCKVILLLAYLRVKWPDILLASRQRDEFFTFPYTLTMVWAQTFNVRLNRPSSFRNMVMIH